MFGPRWSDPGWIVYPTGPVTGTSSDGIRPSSMRCRQRRLVSFGSDVGNFGSTRVGVQGSSNFGRPATLPDDGGGETSRGVGAAAPGHRVAQALAALGGRRGAGRPPGGGRRILWRPARGCGLAARHRLRVADRRHGLSSDRRGPAFAAARVDERSFDLVAHHSCARVEAGLRGLVRCLSESSLGTSRCRTTSCASAI